MLLVWGSQVNATAQLLVPQTGFMKAFFENENLKIRWVVKSKKNQQKFKRQHMLRYK